MSSYKLPVSSWSSTFRHTHTHTRSSAYIFIACLQGNLKNATHQNLASLPFSLSRSLSLSVRLFPSNARLLSSLDCNCNGIFMQNNCLLSTAQRDTEHAQPVLAGRKEGRQPGPNFPGFSWQLKQRGSGVRGGRMKDNGQLGARYFPLISACSNGPLKWL